MNNKQYDEVVRLAYEMNLDLNRCPTCQQSREEKAPGIWHWPQSTYKLYDQEHPCYCADQDNLRRHYLLAGVPMDYWVLSAKDFIGDKNALSEAQEYLSKWDQWRSHGVGLEFYSPIQGTGKTMLSTLIAKDLIKRGERIYFTSFRDAIRTYDIPYEERKDKINRLRHSPLLVLDEVGHGMTSAQSSFYAVELEDLIRFRTAGNGVTIITTNMTPYELDQEYPRTFSLLAAKQRRIKVNGEDARRSGNLDLLRIELIANGESRPIT